MSLKAVVNVAGDEYLEKPSAVEELCAFFKLIDLPTMERLVHECYSRDKKQRFDSRGFAYQDLCNELAQRLGYEVIHGLYRGKKNEIGFDGVWKAPDGHTIIMEAKATGDYAFSPDTVVGYRNRLIAEGQITAEKSSMLIVYGSDDKGGLRNAVRGSSESDNMRLISADALIQLVRMASDAKMRQNIKRIQALLKPQDIVVLDGLVDLMFPSACNSAEQTEKQEAVATQKIRVVEKRNGTQYIPQLPDSSLKVGRFFRTAMENLAASGYVFENDELQRLCGDTALHDIVGFEKRLPFFKRYDPNEKNGNRINGTARFYASPTTFGDQTLYITKEVFETDREPFTKWYRSLGTIAG